MSSWAWLAPLLLSFVSFHFICVSNSQSVNGAEGNNNCPSKETCRDCLRTADCVWCARPLEKSESVSNSLLRCTSRSLAEQNWCSREYIVDKTSSVQVLENQPLRGLDRSGHSAEAIELRPQRLRISLRPGTEVRVPFQYRQAEDYPVDLYYLMDLSRSMAKSKNLLSELGDKIIRSMKNITNNFQIGFGSFVDKPEMPFSSTAPYKLLNPCGNSIACVTPYGYKNHLPLTSDTDRFSREVKSAQMSGNIDSPEGGLDAMMQVLVCTDEIGWRPKARHLLIFSTDASFHLAGDGKLAGIVEPNDETCHLDAEGNYTHSLEMDYPSIWQIDKKAKEKNINIIFAVPSLKEDTYTTLKKYVTGSSIGILSHDSSNVVDLVTKEYNKIVSSVTITDNHAGGSLEIKYKSACLGNEEKFTNECGGIRGRPTINFTAIIKAISCSGNKAEWKEAIEIGPIALNENIEIDIELLCDCPCENPEQQGFEAHSKSCNFYGSLQCGICVCDSGRYGRFCECDGSDAEKSPSETKLCRAKTDVGVHNSDEICSGRGSCKCGKCDCNKRQDPNERIYGTYCECDNFSCDRFDGLVCSGPEKGQCDCGECVCQAGWGGQACNCRDTNSTCIAPNSDKVCSGQGECVCGSCKCNMIDNVRYSGLYCENCPSCPAQRCNELMKCVECQAYKTGPFASDCETQCQDIDVEVVDAIEQVSDLEEGHRADIPNEIRICRTPDDSGCTIIFKYFYEGSQGQLSIWAQRYKECGRGVDVLAIVGGVVGSVVFGGIILLIIWKVCATVHDRREYVKFETERRLAEWDRGDNPLYAPCTSTFTNPTFFSNT